MVAGLRSRVMAGWSLGPIPYYLLRPLRLLKTYDRLNLRQDLVAGVTVAVIALPQAIAFALIAELPPQMGLYATVVAAAVAALWGSSNQAHTGPANAISLLVLSALLSGFTPGTPQFVLAAGLLAVMVGVFQFLLGLASLGVLINFVSHSVIVGFSAGAGLLIAIGQVRPLLGLEFSGNSLAEIAQGIVATLPATHFPTAAVGAASIAVILIARRIGPKLPASLVVMVLASASVAALGLDGAGVRVIGRLPSSLPPLADLPLFNLQFISRLSTGALAVGAIGLVQTMAIARSIGAQTGQRLDSNQEFVGQGLANIAAGLFSGYPCAASFARSAVNFSAGAHTPFAAVISSIFVLMAMLTLGPLGAYLPRSALAGILIIIAFQLINRKEIGRIWGGARGDAIIMIVTFFGTLFLEIAFAVLLGIMLSFALYIMRTSTPRVQHVLPDDDFRHFAYQPHKPSCPQLAIIDILGDLYFGAVSHVEDSILNHLEKHPEQRHLLIRMHNVNICDFSGIHMLENVVRTYRDRGGDVFLVRVSYRVHKLMTATGFCDFLGARNFLAEDEAISHLFYRVLDPAICIYECPVRAFKECQNLPKQLLAEEGIVFDEAQAAPAVKEIEPQSLWQELRSRNAGVTVIDVREPREYRSGHIPRAESVPLPAILSGSHRFQTAAGYKVIFVCRTGRRSRRAAQKVMQDGGALVEIVKGGMVAWESAGLLEAVEGT